MEDDKVIFVFVLIMVALGIYFGYEHEQKILVERIFNLEQEELARTLDSLSAKAPSSLSPEEKVNILASLSTAEGVSAIEEGVLKLLEAR